MTSPQSIPVTPLAQSFFLTGNDIGVLIIHGYGGSIGDYRAYADLLHGYGLSVHGLRLAGHGQGLPALRTTSLADWQSSVTEGVAQLRQRGCTSIFIVGSSFGGVLALDAAKRDPNIAGLVTVNCALSYRGAGMLQGIVLRLLRLVRTDYPKRGLTPAERKQGRQVGSTEAWPIDGILATSRFARHQVIPALPSVTVPILVMASRLDPVVGMDTSHRLLAQIGSTEKTLRPIPLATHRPFRDPAATDFMARETQDFIWRTLAIGRPS